jgi:hypothetical protein
VQNPGLGAEKKEMYVPVFVQEERAVINAAVFRFLMIIGVTLRTDSLQGLIIILLLLY